MQNAEFRMQNEKNELWAKGYIAPELEVVKLEEDNIITTSPGTETTPKEDNDGIWDFDQG